MRCVKYNRISEGIELIQGTEDVSDIVYLNPSHNNLTFILLNVAFAYY